MRLLVPTTRTVDRQNFEGNTALMCALYSKHIGLARMLLAAGADALIANIGGFVPLHVSVNDGRVENVLSEFQFGWALKTQTIGKTAAQNHLPIESW